MTESPLRRDAAMNRERLLAAGREVFAARGLDATLNDVAHHAGVGVGTAYRRFANKEQLIEAIFDQQVVELETILRESLADPDPWNGIVDYLERSISAQARDRGLAQILSGRRMRPERSDWERDRLAPLVDELVDQARRRGAIRPEVTGTDLVFLQIGIIAIAAADAEGDELHRRYLWFMLEGLRPGRPDALALPVRALSTAEAHRVLTQHRHTRA